jgi:bloom syndrome protein
LPFNRKNLFYEVSRSAWDQGRISSSTQVRYRDAEAASDNAHDIADYIIRFRPEAARRNQENGINTKSVTGVIYCRYVYSVSLFVIAHR